VGSSGHPDALIVMIDHSTVASLPILKANWHDTGALLKLEKQCFSPNDAWPLLDILAVLSLPGIVRLKVEHDSILIAFIAAERQVEKSIGWITTIGVAPDYRKFGIAARLLTACENTINMPAICLSVRKSNLAARRLYQHAGYKQVDLWPKYYIGGEDALVLEKYLT